MPLEQMAKIYQRTCFADGCETKTLYPYEYIGLNTWGRASGLGSPTTTKSYQDVIGNLKKTSNPLYLINYQHKKKSVALIKTTVIKLVKNLTIEYLQNDMEILDYCLNEYVKLSLKEFEPTTLR